MNWNPWWLFVITGLVLDFTPGPAVLYVLSNALLEGGMPSGWRRCAKSDIILYDLWPPSIP